MSFRCTRKNEGRQWTLVRAVKERRGRMKHKPIHWKVNGGEKRTIVEKRQHCSRINRRRNLGKEECLKSCYETWTEAAGKNTYRGTLRAKSCHSQRQGETHALLAELVSVHRGLFERQVTISYICGISRWIYGYNLQHTRWPLRCLSVLKSRGSSAGLLEPFIRSGCDARFRILLQVQSVVKEA